MTESIGFYEDFLNDESNSVENSPFHSHDSWHSEFSGFTTDYSRTQNNRRSSMLVSSDTDLDSEASSSDNDDYDDYSRKLLMVSDEWDQESESSLESEGVDGGRNIYPMISSLLIKHDSLDGQEDQDDEVLVDDLILSFSGLSHSKQPNSHQGESISKGSNHSIVKVEVPDFIWKSPDFLPKKTMKKKKSHKIVPPMPNLPSPQKSPDDERPTDISLAISSIGEMTTPAQKMAFISTDTSFLNPPGISHTTPSKQNSGKEEYTVMPGRISRYNPLFYIDCKSLPLIDHSNRSKKQIAQAKRERKKLLAEERKKTQAFFSKLDSFFAIGGIAGDEKKGATIDSHLKEGKADEDCDDESVFSFDSVEVTGMKKTSRKTKAKSKRAKATKKTGKKKQAEKKRGRRVDYEVDDESLKKEHDQPTSINVAERVEAIFSNRNLIFEQYDISLEATNMLDRRCRQSNRQSGGKSRTQKQRKRKVAL